MATPLLSLTTRPELEYQTPIYIHTYAQTHTQRTTVTLTDTAQTDREIQSDFEAPWP